MCALLQSPIIVQTCNSPGQSHNRMPLISSKFLDENDNQKFKHNIMNRTENITNTNSVTFDKAVYIHLSTFWSLCRLS